MEELLSLSGSPRRRTLSVTCWLSTIRRLSLTEAGNFFFQPLKFQLEPPDLFVKFCFLCLLLPLFAFAVRREDSGPVFLQLPFPGPNQAGMYLMLTRQLTNRLTACKRLQSNPKLASCRVSPPFLDHNPLPPLAPRFAPSYTLARGPAFGAQFRPRSI